MKIDCSPAESRMWMRREAGAARNEGTRRDLAKSAKQSSEMLRDRIPAESRMCEERWRQPETRGLAEILQNLKKRVQKCT